MLFVEFLQKALCSKSELLDEVLEGENRDRPPYQVGDVIRASQTYKLCPREEYIAHKEGLVRKDTIAPKMSVVFKHGCVFESWFRDEVLGNKGKVIGKWMCSRCEFVPDDVMGVKRYPKPSVCQKCSGRRFEYVEEFSQDKETRIGGSCDGFLYHNSEYYILEMKTCNDYAYKAFKAMPGDAHRIQVNIYMWLFGYRLARIFYFNKNTGDMCEHVIAIDWDIVNRIRASANALHSAMRGDIFAPAKICSFLECKRAKTCSVTALCFSQKYDEPVVQEVDDWADPDLFMPPDFIDGGS